MLRQDEANPQNLIAVLDSPITGNEVSIAIKEAKRHSAPRLDQVYNKIISSLPKKFTDALVEIFNGFLDTGVVLESWKKALVIFIPKPSDNAVRPISLLSYILKLLERVVY